MFTEDEIINLCWDHIPIAKNLQDLTNIKIAARLSWERKEMGGLEHVQFAYRNNTGIVPIGHSCHPIELLKRGYIDGVGWEKENKKTALSRVNYLKWPTGDHWYASIDGIDITDKNGDELIIKWNYREDAEKAAKKFIEKRGII